MRRPRRRAPPAGSRAAHPERASSPQSPTPPGRFHDPPTAPRPRAARGARAPRRRPGGAGLLRVFRRRGNDPRRRAPRARAARDRGSRPRGGLGRRRLAPEAGALRRPPRPHHPLLRCVPREPPLHRRRRRPSARRRMRFRALLLGARLLVHQRSRRGDLAEGLGRDRRVDPRLQRARGRRVQSRLGRLPRLGVDPRSASRRRTTTGTRTS